MKCAVSGDRAFSREEKLIISKILEEGLRTEKGAKVLVTPTDLNGISDVNKRWYGVIDKSHCGVYFTVSDSLGIKSEHHIFEIEFLERDTMNITPGVKTISD
ncbi:MAG: hypothetical protein HYZ34_00505 [Ignavibacteriae bacterium]|nr:hypothetical protein [Ignavibacteriota bacterium]